MFRERVQGQCVCVYIYIYIYIELADFSSPSRREISRGPISGSVIPVPKAPLSSSLSPAIHSESIKTEGKALFLSVPSISSA